MAILSNGIARSFRAMGLGRLLYHTYFRPLGVTRDLILDGGPIERRRTLQGMAEMQRAADRLPELARPPEAYPVTAAFLTGKDFWYQTLFCFASLQRFADRRIEVRLFDDGTLDAGLVGRLRRVIPWAQIMAPDAVDALLDRHLSRASFPALRSRRDVYPHLRKLTDMHWGRGASLVLDSDMLFFRRPSALLQWMAEPTGVIYLQDVQRAYGYSEGLMADLSLGALPEKANVGLYGVLDSAIDFDYLEACCAQMIAREGGHYLQEQALTALALSKAARQELSETDYRVLPSIPEGRAPSAVLHHYVAHSKRSYFQHGWRHVLNPNGQLAEV